MPSIDGIVLAKGGTPASFAEVRYYLNPTQDRGTHLLAAAIGPLAVATDRAGRFRLPAFAGVEYYLRAVVTPDGDEFPQVPAWTAGPRQPPRLEIDLGKQR